MFITHAAIMYSNGEIVEGWDYQKIHYLAHKMGFTGDHINGFTISSGEFILPDEAATIATRAGQVKGAVEVLSPDDLWPHLAI